MVYLFIMFCVYTFIVLILFSHSVDALVEESGCSLENLATTKFRTCVLAGNWKQVILIMPLTKYKLLILTLNTRPSLFGQVF